MIFFSLYSYTHLRSMLLLFLNSFFLGGVGAGDRISYSCISPFLNVQERAELHCSRGSTPKDHKIILFIWMHKYIVCAFQIPSPWVWYRYWNRMTSTGRLWFQYILKMTSFQNYASETDRKILFSIFNNYLQEIKI